MSEEVAAQIKAYEYARQNADDNVQHDLFIKDLMMGGYLKTWDTAYTEYLNGKLPLGSQIEKIGYKMDPLSRKDFHDMVMGKTYSSGKTTFKGIHQNGDDYLDSYNNFVKTM